MYAIEASSTLTRSLEEMMGQSIIRFKRIRHGRNSRVYRIACEDRREYLAKFYFRSDTDTRDRLDVEFRSLCFLWEHGLRAIPQPIAMCHEKDIGIYEFVYGNRIDGESISKADIDRCVGFLDKLRQIRQAQGARRLPEASEAGGSLQENVEAIQSRLSRLMKVKHDFSTLDDFLRFQFIPAFDEFLHLCYRFAENTDLTYEAETDRTLSPSDFGFHNALRRDDGSIVFLDFEYFGWDDPAKMISDFLLHPAMNLSIHLQRRFYAMLIERFSNAKTLAARIKLVYPLYGLKWCLILLNEFVPEEAARRAFASRSVEPLKSRLLAQLNKSERMLARIINDLRNMKSDSLCPV
ncbi:aminoglycoside phosphotransferase family protein [bacterium]|nr:aminoglycoside phosphotransferase family protein [bacterium]